MEEQTDLERIAEGFMESLRDITDGVKEAGIWCLVHLPYGILWALVILLAVVLLKVRRRKKAAKAQAPAGTGQAREDSRETSDSLEQQNLEQ